MKPVAIIGAGITGLTAALFLKCKVACASKFTS